MLGCWNAENRVKFEPGIGCSRKKAISFFYYTHYFPAKDIVVSENPRIFVAELQKERI